MIVLEPKPKGGNTFRVQPLARGYGSAPRAVAASLLHRFGDLWSGPGAVGLTEGGFEEALRICDTPDHYAQCFVGAWLAVFSGAQQGWGWGESPVASFFDATPTHEVPGAPVYAACNDPGPVLRLDSSTWAGIRTGSVVLSPWVVVATALHWFGGAVIAYASRDDAPMEWTSKVGELMAAFPGRMPEDSVVHAAFHAGLRQAPDMFLRHLLLILNRQQDMSPPDFAMHVGRLEEAAVESYGVRRCHVFTVPRGVDPNAQSTMLFAFVPAATEPGMGETRESAETRVLYPVYVDREKHQEECSQPAPARALCAIAACRAIVARLSDTYSQTAALMAVGTVWGQLTWFPIEAVAKTMQVALQERYGIGITLPPMSSTGAALLNTEPVDASSTLTAAVAAPNVYFADRVVSAGPPTLALYFPGAAVWKGVAPSIAKVDAFLEAVHLYVDAETTALYVARVKGDTNELVGALEPVPNPPGDAGVSFITSASGSTAAVAARPSPQAYALNARALPPKTWKPLPTRVLTSLVLTREVCLWVAVEPSGRAKALVRRLWKHHEKHTAQRAFRDDLADVLLKEMVEGVLDRAGGWAPGPLVELVFRPDDDDAAVALEAFHDLWEFGVPGEGRATCVAVGTDGVTYFGVANRTMAGGAVGTVHATHILKPKGATAHAMAILKCEPRQVAVADPTTPALLHGAILTCTALGVIGCVGTSSVLEALRTLCKRVWIPHTKGPFRDLLLTNVAEIAQRFKATA